MQEKLKSTDDINAVVEIAKAAGYTLSADALRTAQEEVPEEELDSVGGGTCSSLWLGFMWVAAGE